MAEKEKGKEKEEETPELEVRKSENKLKKLDDYFQEEMMSTMNSLDFISYLEERFI